MIVARIDRTNYNYPVKKIMKVRFTQMRLPHATGLTSTDRIPISISGIASIANFFQILKTRSEKIIRNINEAEIKRGVYTIKGINSLKTHVLHE